jgi:hypothetical protein
MAKPLFESTGRPRRAFLHRHNKAECRLPAWYGKDPIGSSRHLEIMNTHYLPPATGLAVAIALTASAGRALDAQLKQEVVVDEQRRE